MKKVLKFFRNILLIAIPAVLGFIRIVYNYIFEKNCWFKIKALRFNKLQLREEARCGKWARENASEEVSITSRDDLELIGHWIYAEKPERIVILFTGWRALWDGVLTPVAKWLHSVNCNLLLVETRASGLSEGKTIGMGMLERDDVRCWVNYCTYKNSDLPVYLYGLSMGCASVLLAADSSWDKKVSGIIADCGFASPYEQIAYILKKRIHLPEHPAMDMLDIMVRLKMGKTMKKFDTRETINNCSVPILFIHGDADDFVPASNTEDNYRVYEGPKSKFVVSGAKHAEAYFIGRGEYQRRVLELFKRA